MNWLIRFINDLYEKLRGEYQTPITYSTQPPEAPKQPLPAPISPQTMNTYPDWNTQKHAYHNTRVICDRLGLSLEQKNVLCACVFQESQFKVGAINKNRAADGTVLSTDWGIAQVNDHYHIGKGKDFPSVEYVLANPEKVIEWMASIMKRTGKLQPWVSYSSGAYKHWLSTTSPMWTLKS